MPIMDNIQDLLVDLSDDVFVEGAIDFEHITVIKDDDISIIENQEALWQSIVNVLSTPLGYIDGVTLERFGSKLLSLRGVNVNYHIVELAKVYINETIPQFEGRVYSFPVIDITTPTPTVKKRFSMKIQLTVDSIYGRFSRTFYI